MPRVVRWYLLTALVMFLLALLVGAFQALGGIAIPMLPELTPVNFHY